LGHTHEAEQFPREISFVKYNGEIAKFLLEMKNLNIYARVSWIAWREMIEGQIREDALRRVS